MSFGQFEKSLKLPGTQNTKKMTQGPINIYKSVATVTQNICEKFKIEKIYCFTHTTTAEK